MAPAVVGKYQLESDRSFCGSDNGLSDKSGKGRARVVKVTRRHPTEATSFHAKATSPNDSSTLVHNLREREDTMRCESTSHRIIKNTEEVSRPILEEDTAFFAGT